MEPIQSRSGKSGASAKQGRSKNDLDLTDDGQSSETEHGSSLDEQIGYFDCSATNQHGWYPLRDIRLPMGDRGFRQGVTAVERLRTYDGHIFNLDRHLVRFEQTLKSIGLLHVVPIESIASLASELLDRNQPSIAKSGDVGMTWWVTPDSFALHCNVIDHAAVKHRRHFGQPVVLTKVQQPGAQSWSRQAKVRSRLHYYLADHEANLVVSGATGLLQDDDGSWTESSVANVAIVTHQKILFAPREQVLHGITQSVVRELAIDLEIECSERKLCDRDLATADEVLLMGTDTGLWFASEVVNFNGSLINQLTQPHANSIVRRLQARLPQATSSLHSSR